jgi:hypothetical protein
VINATKIAENILMRRLHTLVYAQFDRHGIKILVNTLD